MQHGPKDISKIHEDIFGNHGDGDKNATDN